MKVEFRLLGGKRCEVDVEAGESVEQVKQKVAPLLEVDPKTTTMVYKGKLVKDADTMESLKVAEGSSIHVVSRKGAPTPSPSAAAAPAGAAAAPPAPGATPGAAPQQAFNPMAAFGGGLEGIGAGLEGLGAGLGAGFPNPQMMAQLMQSPQMQQMMQSLMANPQVMIDMIQNNPLLRQMTEGNPAMRSMLQNPDALRSMLSPGAMQGMLNMMGGGAAPAAAAAPPATAPATAGATPAAPAAGSAGDAVADHPLLRNILQMNPELRDTLNNPEAMRNMFSPESLREAANLMSSLGGAGLGGLGAALGGAGLGGAPSPAPASSANLEEQFASQIKQLEEMGFLDKQANIQALQLTGGDVNAAINVLLERGFGN